MSKTKVYAASITESIKSTNSTCPLPQSSCAKPTNQLSRDVATLYEIFSTVPTTKHYNDQGVVCYCCDREIIKRSNDSLTTINDNCEDDRKRKLEDVTPNNKITSALYYGSKQVRKYMKKVMTRECWSDIIKEGFPCPHKVLWSKGSSSSKRSSYNSSIHSSHHFCTLCDTEDQTQHTLRLTLTPSTCRAQDKEIYGEYNDLQSKSKKTKKRKEKKGKLLHF